MKVWKEVSKVLLWQSDKICTCGLLWPNDVVAQIKLLGLTIIESPVKLDGGSEDLSNYYLIAELVLKNFSIIEFMHPLNRVAQLN